MNNHIFPIHTCDCYSSDKFDDWAPLNVDKLHSIPTEHGGVYLWARKDAFGRFQGKCNLLYVGKSNNLKRRLTQHMRFQGYSEEAHRLWKKELDQSILVSCAYADDKDELIRIEREMLQKYFDIHHELPPGNRRAYV